MRRGAALASLTAATVLAVSACGVPRSPDVPPSPAVEAPAAWRAATDVTVPAPDPQGWQGFGDATLVALVERAVARNTDVATAVARLSEARAQAALARAQLSPSLDLGATLSRTRSLSAVTGRPVETSSAQPQFQAAYEIDLFGRLADLSEAARAAFLASATARDATALAVASSTAGGYVTLRGLDARLRIAQETVAARAESLRFARSRADAGYTSRLELRQAEVEYESAVQLVPQLRLGIARQENALRLLLGDVPGDVPRGTTLLEMRLPSVPAGLPADVLRRRPDLAQAEFALAGADASLNAARKQFLPTVRLTGSTGLLLLNSLSDPTTLWTLGGSVLAPIFSGGRLAAQVDAAAARREQAAFAYRRAALTAFREVEDALAALDNLARQAESLERQRDLLTDTLRLATSRYRADYSAYLEQLDAQRGLLNAELLLLQSRADLLGAAVSLYQAMGGGWTSVREAERPVAD